MRSAASYSHVHLAQVAVAVLNDVGVFGAVEHGDRAFVALGSDVVVGRVDGHGHDVDTQVTDEHDARALITDQDSHTNVHVCVAADCQIHDTFLFCCFVTATGAASTFTAAGEAF